MRNVSGAQGREYVYTPDVDGEPLRVVLRSPTEADKRHYRRTMTELAARSGTVSHEAVTVEALRLCVVRVEEYTRDGESGAKIPIETVDDLMRWGEIEVVDDVGAHVLPQFALTFEQKKRLAKPSGSSSPANRQSSIAATVTPEGSAGQEGAPIHASQMATSS